MHSDKIRLSEHFNEHTEEQGSQLRNKLLLAHQNKLIFMFLSSTDCDIIDMLLQRSSVQSSWTASSPEIRPKLAHPAAHQHTSKTIHNEFKINGD